MENKITMTELKTTLTMKEVLEINALLDMERDMKLHQQELQEAAAKRR